MYLAYLCHSLSGRVDINSKKGMGYILSVSTFVNWEGTYEELSYRLKGNWYLINPMHMHNN